MIIKNSLSQGESNMSRIYPCLNYRTTKILYKLFSQCSQYSNIHSSVIHALELDVIYARPLNSFLLSQKLLPELFESSHTCAFALASYIAGTIKPFSCFPVQSRRRSPSTTAVNVDPRCFRKLGTDLTKSNTW